MRVIFVEKESCQLFLRKLAAFSNINEFDAHAGSKGTLTGGEYTGRGARRSDAAATKFLYAGAEPGEALDYAGDFSLIDEIARTRICIQRQ